jgi:hypothetical protein
VRWAVVPSRQARVASRTGKPAKKPGSVSDTGEQLPIRNILAIRAICSSSS